ncbi:ABC transporter permease [Bradyrhizobium sp. U87765 SZCCT0131]|uniref:ABC transporter permease n=1 Tax=unclassified Bradyrhizobium TaxID=2631580 RepID=UPI001BA6B694|nr:MULTISPECIES: ABC transporter permease [unclassified Bradyrhizobium]MBR1221673.1 ABC transporter permease [Bradyrhizobium sp. U87765 SZCCT0131]MBR1264404.1 ABC transporter permease [Bradyrhizobium sp. U87765 SZCCT0134]MBR1304689.1 ABC transporter permease [Bradyrhizobium sp. U87765 SZCCT0110]MBR1322454.1 ABC transporter permease [Bradyrhizobium sp. U87765 SZCCT0109]MBR1346618.1 ABC transporter permease [Bradyrhizobium sp. U87765 SZCCT0048]
MTLVSSDGHTSQTVREPAVSFEDAFKADFLRAQRLALWRRTGLNILGVLIFIAVWEAIPRYSTWINEVLFPPPSQVIQTFIPMLWSGEIARNIVISLGRAASGFSVALILGLAAGLVTARVRTLQYLAEPLLHGFRAIPTIALVPLCILWFGIGEPSKVALVAWGAFFPIWITTFIGVRDVHVVYLRSAACLGAGRIATLLLIVLPAALPFILSGIRQAIAVSLIVLVAAELSGASAGVAYMMSQGHQLFRVDIMFIGLVLLGIFGFLADRIFVALARRLFPWYEGGS